MRHYRLVFTTKGPVHIGNGETLGKKDYFLSKDGTIAVLDAPSFAGKLNEEQLDFYCKFLQTNSRLGLQDLLDQDTALRKLALSSIKYKTTTKLTQRRGGGYQYLEVHACIKDQESRPYIPGSSVKGMLRNAILSVIILSNQREYRRLFDSDAGDRLDTKSLDRAAKDIERHAFWTDAPDHTDPGTVRDVMRYVSVSDSDPLDASCLAFAKKYDKFSKDDDGHHKHDMGNLSDRSYYEGNQLNIYRECIKPGTQVSVDVDIDERIDSFLPLELDAKGLQNVLLIANKLYDECFLSAFDIPRTGSNGATGAAQAVSDDGLCQYVYKAGPFAGTRCRNRSVDGTGYCNKHKAEAQKAAAAASASQGVTCYLGGGVGYDSKTVINAVLRGDPKRVQTISRILYSQFPSKVNERSNPSLYQDIRRAGFSPRDFGGRPRGRGPVQKKDDHRHWEDAALAVSPHTLKLGIIGSKKYQMGLCDVRIEERS